MIECEKESTTKVSYVTRISRMAPKRESTFRA
jgi:hypothetical protein